MSDECRRFCTRCNAEKPDNLPCAACGSPEFRLEFETPEALAAWRAKQMAKPKKRKKATP